MTELKADMTLPEKGWRRYNSIELSENVRLNERLKETRSDAETIYTDSGNGNLKNTLMFSFSFIGTGIRLLSYFGSDRATDLRIIIDGNEYMYSERNSYYIRNGLSFEMNNLSESEHKVEMYSGTNGSYSNFTLSAIDLKEGGYIIPKQKNIGDQLMVPQLNWTRYDDTDPIIKNIGSVTKGNNHTSYYKKTYTDYIEKDSGFEIVTDKVSKIRIIGNAFGVGNNNGSKEFYVEVDGALKGTFTTRLLTGTVTQILLAEVELPDNGEHTIKVYRGSEGLYFTLDAIDLYTNPVEYKHLLYKDGEYGYVEKNGEENKIPAMTGYTIPKGIVESDGYYGNNYEPWRAFNRKSIDIHDAWATAPHKTNGIISYEFEEKEIITKYTLRSRTPYVSILEMPSKWTFDALDDNGNWITLDSRENEKFEIKVKKEYEIENEKSYKKYRLNVLDNGGDFNYTPTFTCIGDIEMIGAYYIFTSLGTSIPTDEQFEQYGVEDLKEWLPFINEIQGEKKIITKTSEPLQSLNVDYLPETQFIKQNDFMKINKETLGTLSINEGQTKGNIRVAAQFPDVDTFSYVFKDNTWSKIVVTDATVFSENGNTIDEMNLADWSTSPLNQQVRFIYTMKMNDIKDSVILSSIDIKLKGVVSSTPIIKKAISLIKAYTFNGYLENIERLNTINFEKLEFKSDSLINAQQNQMHNLVIDVFNSDSMESVSSTNTNYQDLAALTGKPLGESFLYEFSIDDKEIVGVK